MCKRITEEYYCETSKYNQTHTRGVEDENKNSRTKSDGFFGVVRGMTRRTTVIYVVMELTAIDEELLKVAEIDVLVMDVTGLGAVVMDARKVLDAVSLPLGLVILVRGPEAVVLLRLLRGNIH